MPLTKSFKELVQRRVASDVKFGDALLREGIDAMLSGDNDASKAIIRDDVKGDVLNPVGAGAPIELSPFEN